MKARKKGKNHWRKKGKRWRKVRSPNIRGRSRLKKRSKREHKVKEDKATETMKKPV